MRETTKMQIAGHTFMIIATLLAILPFLLLIIASVTDNTWATANGFSYFPKKWSLDAYLYIANSWKTIGRAYIVTIVVTIIGTVCSILMTSLFAYGLSNNNIPGNKIISIFVIFTMLFNGGLVATYYIYTNLFHIRDTIFALLVPNLMMNAFNIIIVIIVGETRGNVIFQICCHLVAPSRVDAS